MKSIAAAAASEGQGYAAVKVRAAHPAGYSVAGSSDLGIRTGTQQRSSSAACRGAQVTALGQPKLLERVSDSLNAVHNLFRRFDEDLNGVVTRDEFEKVGFAMAFTVLTRTAVPSKGSSLLQTWVPMANALCSAVTEPMACRCTGSCSQTPRQSGCRRSSHPWRARAQVLSSQSMFSTIIHHSLD